MYEACISRFFLATRVNMYYCSRKPRAEIYGEGLVYSHLHLMSTIVFFREGKCVLEASQVVEHNIFNWSSSSRWQQCHDYTIFVFWSDHPIWSKNLSCSFLFKAQLWKAGRPWSYHQVGVGIKQHRWSNHQQWNMCCQCDEKHVHTGRHLGYELSCKSCIGLRWLFLVPRSTQYEKSNLLWLR